MLNVRGRIATHVRSHPDDATTLKAAGSAVDGVTGCQQLLFVLLIRRGRGGCAFSPVRAVSPAKAAPPP